MAEARRLDPTQRAAAAADAPVQLTLAGPGAGKTTTLAVRFVHLVRQGVDPRRILAVTFTRKAAIEMQDRIVRLLRWDGPKGLAVDTFHAFAFRHLRRQPQRFGLPEQFDLWDVPQQRHVFHARRMWWNEEIDIIDLIGGMKERLIDAAGFARMVGDKSDELRAYYPAAVEFFNVYEAALCDAGAIDFADMVPLVTRAMAHDTACRSAITGAFDHILVDEYQDVNPGQLDLIAHFVAAGVKLWAVGDDDQTLYAFRASDIRTILDFGRHHPGARIHTLEVNYRAGAAIVDAAKALIRHNRTRIDKDYRPALTEPGEIVIRGYSSPEIEARQVAAAIAELLSQGEAPGQITILYRAGAIGLNFQTALKERQIPFEVRGSGDLWQSVGARLVVGALHYLHGGATVAAMSRLGTGQRSRIIVEHLDQIRPTSVMTSRFPARMWSASSARPCPPRHLIASATSGRAWCSRSSPWRCPVPPSPRSNGASPSSRPHCAHRPMGRWCCPLCTRPRGSSGTRFFSSAWKRGYCPAPMLRIWRKSGASPMSASRVRGAGSA